MAWTESSCSPPPRCPPGVSAGELLFSLIALTLVYAGLMVVEVGLLVKFVRGGVVSAMPELAEPPHGDASTPKNDDVLSFAY